jgi:hypothetical protein
MDIQQKSEFLKNEIEDRIDKVTKQRIRDKNKAYRLKMAAVVLGAIITILLGLRVNSSISNVFANIALAFSAIILVVNTWDAFYNHRALWIQKTIMLSRLLELKRELVFYISGMEPSDIDGKTLEKYLLQFESILKDDLKEWVKLREQSVSIQENTPAVKTH